MNEPHRGQRQHRFRLNPDNFIGVELCASYTMGPVYCESAHKGARYSGERALRMEIARLVRYFHDPEIHLGEICEEIREEQSSRGTKTYRLYLYQAVEITEKGSQQ